MLDLYFRPNGGQGLLGSVLALLHLPDRISLDFMEIGDNIHSISDSINNIVRTPALRYNLNSDPRSVLMVTFQNKISKLFRPVVRDLRLFFSSHRSPSSTFFPTCPLSPSCPE